jgi:hypothetical protein
MSDELHPRILLSAQVGGLWMVSMGLLINIDDPRMSMESLRESQAVRTLRNALRPFESLMVEVVQHDRQLEPEERTMLSRWLPQLKNVIGTDGIVPRSGAVR